MKNRILLFLAVMLAAMCSAQTVVGSAVKITTQPPNNDETDFLLNWDPSTKKINSVSKANLFQGVPGQTLQQVSDTGGLDNGSTIRQGVHNEGTGGNSGIELVCSVGYPLKWEGGALYSKEVDGTTDRHFYFKSSLDVKGLINVEQGIDNGVSDFSKLQTSGNGLYYKARSGNDGDNFGSSELSIRPEIGFQSVVKNPSGAYFSILGNDQGSVNSIVQSNDATGYIYSLVRNSDINEETQIMQTANLINIYTPTGVYINDERVALINDTNSLYNSTITAPSSRVFTNALNGKQDILTSGINIASINGVSLLNGGNISTTNDLRPYQLTSDKGVSNGYASLDSSGKVPLTQINDALIGSVNYKGTWNASTNSPSLLTVQTKGSYYVVATSGTFNSISFLVGDWIISDGTSWSKLDNTGAVISVAGRAGVVTLNKSDVGLANADNTSDASKPVSTATQTALDLKANLASPTFTGTVTIPTGSLVISGGSSTNYIRGDGQINSFNGGVRSATLSGLTTGSNTSITAASTVVSAFQDVQAQINARATLASPTFTGTPLAPTATTGTNTTQVATTAFVNSSITSVAGIVDYPEQTYANTISWTGTTAPSGTATLKYRAYQSGKTVTVRISGVYSVSGTMVSSVAVQLPTALPSPETISGFTSSGDFAGFVNASIIQNTSSPNGAAAGLFKNGSNYNVVINTASGSIGNANGFMINLTYLTN